VLEERRQGEARLESMSPGELLIVVRSTDRAGHMGAVPQSPQLETARDQSRRLL
jgi:hypothetical protein